MGHERILVVEDEEDIRNLVLFNLGKEGYRVVGVESGERALEATQADPPDLVLLDLMLPGIDGLEVCRRLRAEPRTAQVTIIMLTAKGEEADIVTGLEVGADDYITKPFSPKVLIARIRADLRKRQREEPTDDAPIQLHGLLINPSRHEVRVAGKPVDLTATEFALLQFLARRPGWVFTRAQIIEGVKGDDYPVTDRAVDVQVLGLRRKLGDHGDCIETVRGVGYRFREA